MKKYKICIYAICKNEEKFVDRWYNSVKKADKVIVLDTGSTDNSVEKLKSHDIEVYEEKIIPWRFDVARNKSISLIPKDYDICVCLDLDEVLKEGWREEIEKSWDENTTRLRYTYNWSLDENDNPKVTFLSDKIHSRNDYIWTHPVHEILKYIGPKEEKFKINENLIINHYPDNEKSRGGYLPLLELSVIETPEDDRNMHYLGREYMYYGRWNEAIDTLIKHLHLKTATWKDERSASMRFIARCYKNLGRYEESEMWLKKAINETPYLRDPLVEMLMLKYVLQDWKEMEYYGKKALEITKKEKTYINEVFSWDHTIYDLLAICFFHQNKKDEALRNINIAIFMNPNDERLRKNKDYILNMQE